MLPSLIKEWIEATFPRQWAKYVIWRSPKEAEWFYLERVVPRDMVSIDVGANIGIYTSALAKLTPVVHAFEPSPRLAMLLQKSVPKNVCVHQQAVSDKAGTATLRTPVTNGNFATPLATLENTAFDNFTEEAVTLSTLDDVITGQVGFIKIDVEGHELKALNGALNIIKTHRPIFLIECEEWHGAGNLLNLLDFFEKIQYFGYFLKSGCLTPIKEFNQHRDQTKGVSTPYIYNFFFFPKRQV